MRISTGTPWDWTGDKIAVVISLMTMIGASLTLYWFVEYPWEPPHPWRLDVLFGLITGYIVLKMILIAEDASTEPDAGD
jgi:hypothetical protein